MAELDAAESRVEVGITESSDGVVVALSGELDVANVGVVDAALAPILDRGLDRLIVDLTELRFMDSSGLAVLIAASTRGTYVELRHASALIREVVRATGLSDVLHLEEAE